MCLKVSSNHRNVRFTGGAQTSVKEIEETPMEEVRFRLLPRLRNAKNITRLVHQQVRLQVEVACLPRPLPRGTGVAEFNLFRRTDHLAVRAEPKHPSNGALLRKVLIASRWKRSFLMETVGGLN
jgi:hypothetical protein